jgi:hypothetical protein
MKAAVFMLLIIIMLLLASILVALPPHRAYAAGPIDGTGYCTTSGGSCALTISTTQSNDVVIVFASTYAGAISAPTSTGLTFTQRYNAQIDPTDHIYAAEYYVVAGSPLSSQSITCSWGASGTQNFCMAIAISGYTTITGGVTFDTLYTNYAGSGTSVSVTFSTVSNAIVLGLETSYCYNSGSYSASSPFTIILNNIGTPNSCVIGNSQYHVYTTAQTNAANGGTLPASNAWAIISDAIDAPPPPLSVADRFSFHDSSILSYVSGLVSAVVDAFHFTEQLSSIVSGLVQKVSDAFSFADALSKLIVSTITNTLTNVITSTITVTSNVFYCASNCFTTTDSQLDWFWTAVLIPLLLVIAPAAALVYLGITNAGVLLGTTALAVLALANSGILPGWFIVLMILVAAMAVYMLARRFVL